MPRSWNAKAMKHVARLVTAVAGISLMPGRSRPGGCPGEKLGVGRAAKTLLRVHIATAQQL
jgi:hypothetical protein